MISLICRCSNKSIRKKKTAESEEDINNVVGGKIHTHTHAYTGKDYNDLYLEARVVAGGGEGPLYWGCSRSLTQFCTCPCPTKNMSYDYSRT